MPTRNAIKEYDEDSYYHLYSCGNNKQKIFIDDQDYTVFLGYLKRYLSSEQRLKPNRQKFRNFSKELDLLAYCIMPNHIHLLVYQSINPYAISQVMSAYSRYFNTKCNRRGGIFESRYLASRITQDAYLRHISRYIHLNPREWKNWSYSSLQYYTGQKHAEWIKPDRILELFNSSDDYLSFVHDYEDQKNFLDDLKLELDHD